MPSRMLGGLGHFAAQIAKLHGLKVIGTAPKPKTLELLRQLQLDHVIDYSKQNVVEEIMGAEERRRSGSRLPSQLPPRARPTSARTHTVTRCRRGAWHPPPVRPSSRPRRARAGLSHQGYTVLCSVRSLCILCRRAFGLNFGPAGAGQRAGHPDRGAGARGCRGRSPPDGRTVLHRAHVQRAHARPGGRACWPGCATKGEQRPSLRQPPALHRRLREMILSAIMCSGGMESPPGGL